MAEAWLEMIFGHKRFVDTVVESVSNIWLTEEGRYPISVAPTAMRCCAEEEEYNVGKRRRQYYCSEWRASR